MYFLPSNNRSAVASRVETLLGFNSPEEGGDGDGEGEGEGEGVVDIIKLGLGDSCTSKYSPQNDNVDCFGARGVSLQLDSTDELRKWPILKLNRSNKVAHSYRISSPFPVLSTSTALGPREGLLVSKIA
jgi:hypothetical protein